MICWFQVSVSFLADFPTGDHPCPLWVGWLLGLARRAVILTLPLLFFSIGFPIPGCQVFLHFLWFFRSWYTDRGMLLTHLSLESFCCVLACFPPRSVHSCHPGSSSSFHSFCGNSLRLCSCVKFFFPVVCFSLFWFIS